MKTQRMSYVATILEKIKQYDGGEEYCTCPNCGYQMLHVKGVPCDLQSCPECSCQMLKGYNKTIGNR